MLRKVLIANRGEIAVRILRTLREMDITSVAVFSDADAAAPHVRLADEAYPIGPAAAVKSYLNVDALIEAAKRSGCDGVAPGYGFLSENAQFAARCARENLTFIGPPVGAIDAMGSKTEARERMEAAGVPVVPGGPARDLEQAKETAAGIGYPVMITAALGGGGKGMRRVNSATELEATLERARSESSRAFGDSEVYLEKALDSPRHIEIQILGDQHGNVIHLFERDCSLQRRHQKVLEETPSPALDEETLERMGAVAIRAARAVDYYSAGTVEFLLDASGAFYFLEMNTRLQVEHPITELVTGLDLVREMLRIAQGERLTTETIERRGHAVECRIYAEDPARGFLPSPGTIHTLRMPEGPYVRVDSGVSPGVQITPYYDPLLAKICTWGRNRNEAIQRMRRALREALVVGPRTNLEFFGRLLEHRAFVEGRYDTHFLEAQREALVAPLEVRTREMAALAVAEREHDQRTEQGPLRSQALSAWSTSGDSD